MKGLQGIIFFLVVLGCLHECCGILVTKNMRLTSGINSKPMKHRLDLSRFKSLSANSSLHPIVLIPGVGGSQLSAFAGKGRPDPWYCGSSKSCELAPGPMLSCWSSNIALNYSAVDGTFSNATGVQIMVNDFGGTSGIEYIDPAAKDATMYFGNMADALAELGYVRGQNLLGAPYDWRLPPTYLPTYMQALQEMIEDAYNLNQTKVAVVCHSLGNLFFLSLLQTMSQEWKDKYILTYFATSPPIVGAFAAAQSLASGYQFSIPYLPPSTAKIVQRTFPSTYFLLPYTKFYQSQVLISTPAKNYTSEDYQELFNDLGVADMYEPYILSFDTAKPYDPPGVPTYCLHGYNVSTAIQEIYTDMTFTKPTIIMGDGDGTVPIDSLTFCKNWADSTDKELVVKSYEGQDHVALLSWPPMIEDIIGAIFNTTKS